MSSSHRHGVTVVRVTGEADIATRSVLRSRLTRAVRGAGRLLVVDLTGLSFADASGTAALAEVLENEAGDAVVSVVGMSPMTARVWDVLRLIPLLRHPTLEDALRELSPQGSRRARYGWTGLVRRAEPRPQTRGVPPG